EVNKKPLTTVASLAALTVLISGCESKGPAGPAPSSLMAELDAAAYSAWSTPVNLGPVINTAGDENRPAISKDGLSLYVSSNRPGGFGGLDLWVSRRASVDAPWGPLQKLGPAINSYSAESAPTFSPDGHHL